MALLLLEINGLRNLSSASLSPASGINLLFGDNGSGKTTVLEAIYLLGMARSFRSQQLRSYLQIGAECLTIFGQVETAASTYSLGIKKQFSNTTTIKFNGQRQASSSVLAGALPLQLLTPESHQLLSGEPRERRSYMDWGLFHVEHAFLELSKTYRRLLQQRNATLRENHHIKELSYWDYKLAEIGEVISAQREKYLELVTPLFNHFYELLLDNVPPSLVYRRGWSKGVSLLEVLQRNHTTEQAAGYTMQGPHRADFRLIDLNGLNAVDVFSRGQQKLAVCALRLAQMQHMQDVNGLVCTLLLDDLPAELDVQHRQLLMQAINKTGAQCFVTATSAELLDLSAWEKLTVFHVEHGAVIKVV
ncbi:MAG: DNA replication/repair protein RecF [Thiohalomonadaceae bacterium]|jgi:DNA replication and repair protein RecF